MTGIAIHGGITFLGKDSSAANLDLEELAVDPVNPSPGRLWYNTTEQRIKYAEEATDGSETAVIRSLPNSVDIATLQAYVDENYAHLATELNVKPDVQDLAMIIQATLAMKADSTTVTQLQTMLQGKADQSALDALQAQVDGTIVVDTSGLQEQIDTKAASSELATVSQQVTALSAEVTSKLTAADLVPIQNSLLSTQTNMSAVQIQMASKVDRATTLAGYGITDAVNASALGTSVPLLDPQTGKIRPEFMDQLHITDTFPVSSEVEMLTLVAQKGDVAVRTDEGKTYILRTGEANVLSNWELLATPSESQVTSVNGMQGSVQINNISGNAGTATRLQDAAMVVFEGDSSGVMFFDGSSTNVSLDLANIHDHSFDEFGNPTSPTQYGFVKTAPKVTFDEKGRVVGSSGLHADDVVNALGYQPYDVNDQNLQFLQATAPFDLRGDIEGSAMLGDTFMNVSLPQIVQAGTGSKFAFDSKGRITEALSATTLADYGITDALASSDNRLFDIQIRIVSKNPGEGEYSSITAAMASITDAAADKPYLIRVSAGYFEEFPIVFKPYVYLQGSGDDATVIKALDATNHLITGAHHAGVMNALLTGATGTDKAAVFYRHPTGATNVIFSAAHVRFGNNHTHVRVEAGQVICDSVIYGSTYSFVKGFVAENDGSLNAVVMIRNGTSNGMTAPYPDAMFYASGSKSQVQVGTAFARSSNNLAFGSGVGVGLHLRDGAGSRIVGVSLVGFAKGIWVENVGAAPALHAIAGNLQLNNQDIVIDHPGATGSFNGNASRVRNFVTPEAKVTILYADVENQGMVNVGPILLGRNHSKLVDVSPLITRSLLTGVMEGGAISSGTGLNVSVTSGFGYLRDNNDLLKVEWNATTVPVAPGQTQYIYVDNTSTIRASVSLPDGATNVILGRCITGASSIIFIGSLGSTNMLDFHTNMDKLQKLAIGALYVSGSLVTENVTLPRAINVSAGHYFYSAMEVRTVAKEAVNFLVAYSANGQTTLAMQTQFDNTSYDDGTTLAPLGSGRFNKHVLYTNGHGDKVNYLVRFGTGNYETLEEAMQAPLPPPQFDPAGSPAIASVIVQQGVSNIVLIQDIRPRFTGGGGASASGVSQHGDLLGLANDDHAQYLLVDGNRAMTGDLNLDGNDLVNVGSLNGVAVDAMASRHLPNGADPLATAAPTTSISDTSINGVGIANSLARSDHTHALDDTVWTDTNHPSTLSGYGITDAIASDVAKTITAQHTFAPATVAAPFVLGPLAHGALVEGMNVEFLDGLQAADFTPRNSFLDSITELATNGLMTRNGTAVRAAAVVGTANQISIVNGNGAAGDPTIALANNVRLPGTEGMVLPAGGTSQRPAAPTAGTVRFNNNLSIIEAYAGSAWQDIANVVLYQSANNVGAATGTTQIVPASTVPVATGGTAVAATGSIMRTHANSRFKIDFTSFVDSGTAGRTITAILVKTLNGGGTPTVVAATSTNVTAVGNLQQLDLSYVETNPPTGGATYEIRIGISGSGSWFLNRGSGTTYGNVGNGVLSVMEYVSKIQTII